MADENPSAGATVPAVSDVAPATPPAPTAPAVPATAAPPAPAPAAPVATPPAAPPMGDPNWLAPRITEAKKAEQARVLKELGVTDIAAAKAAIADANARIEASKTSEQKAAEALAQLATTRTQAELHAAVISEHAGRMLMVLTAEQQALVRSFAGDDPVQQLATIQKLTDAKLLFVGDEPDRPATPATTAPPPTAPIGAPGNSPPDHKAVYSSETNPFRRAAYGARNPQVYQPKKS